MRVVSAIAMVVLAMVLSVAYADATWTAFLDANAINDIALDGVYLWCATEEGGLVQWSRHSRTYRQYNVFDGLAANTVHAVAADSSGLIWIGTDRGLQSFDGAAWMTYGTQDGLADNDVGGIFVDSNNVKWLWYRSAPNGVTRFDGVNWTTFRAEEGPSLGDDGVLAMAEDPTGLLWFGTARGVSSHDGATWRNYSDELSPLYSVCTIAADENGTTWFGGAGGLVRYDGQSWQYHHIRELLGYADTWYDAFNWVRLIVIAEDGALWIATCSGLVVFDKGDWLVWDSAAIADLVCDPQGVIWGGGDSGLRRYDNQDCETLRTDPVCGPWGVQALGLDTEDLLWVGTQEMLYSFDGEAWIPWRFTDALAGDSFTAIAVDRCNVKWIGSQDEEQRSDDLSYRTVGKVTRLEGDAWTTFVLGEEAYWVTSIAVDHGNVKWFATTDGVRSFDGSGWQTYTTDNSDLPHNLIYAVAIDHENAAWFATHDGVARFDGSSWTVFRGVKDGWSFYARNIVVDANDTKWFSGDNGVFRYDGESWKRYGPEDGLAGYEITALAVDHDNVLWAGTRRQGVSRFDGVTWQTLASWQRMSQEFVRAMAADRANNIWFGTTTGLLKYDQMTTRVEQATDASRMFLLTANYPNPFNTSTTIGFSLPRLDSGTFVVYNIAGQRVRRLLSGQLAAGFHAVRWNGDDEWDMPVASGVYIFQLEGGSYASAGKMLLLR